MSDTPIRVEKLGKRYLIRHQPKERYLTLRATLADGAKEVYQRVSSLFRSYPLTTSDEFWALKDVSFEVRQGEVVGIIGRNGAGKSTLLKLLSRITEPTAGSIRLKGRVASLLEVGTGFHPELTGRENIFLNGAILGMSKTEISRKFDEIVDFSEIETFLDTPVKRYSSGMYVRLAFAVAAHLEPEILLVDEVLAVGDAFFQKKCLGKMERVSSEGRTVLFVSHNMSAIASLSSRAILIESGKLLAAGPVSSVLQEYLTASDNDTSGAGEVWFPLCDNKEDAPFVLHAIRTLDENNAIRSSFTSSEPITVEIEYSLKTQIPYLRIGFELKTPMDTLLFTSFHNDVSEVLPSNLQPEKHVRLRTTIPPNTLNGGQYYLDPCIGVHTKKWLVKGIRGVRVNITLTIPNQIYSVRRRAGDMGLILSWVADDEPLPALKGQLQ